MLPVPEVHRKLLQACRIITKINLFDSNLPQDCNVTLRFDNIIRDSAENRNIWHSNQKTSLFEHFQALRIFMNSFRTESAELRYL